MNIDRSIAPGSRTVDRLNILKPETAWLDNGIPVYMINAGLQEVCRIELIFDAGSYYQPQPCIALFTHRLMTEGTRKRSGFEIASLMEYYGAYLSTYSRKDVAGISLSFINSKSEQVLPLLEEIVKYPNFPEDEFLLLTEKEKKNFMDDRLKVERVAHREFNEMIFGKDHPYGRKTGLEDFDRLQREELTEFHRSRYLTKHCFILATGKLPRDLMKSLNVHFGSSDWFSGIEAADPEVDGIAFPAASRAFTEMPEVLQTAIRIGKRTIGMQHPDHTKFSILNTVLGGYFGSRLMTNIREDKGYTYGIYSALSAYKRSGAFYISTEVDAGVWKKALKEIYKEMDRLRQTKVPAAELELVRNYMLGSLQRSLDGPFATAAFVRSLIENDIGIETYISDLFGTIRTITPEDILEIAQNYLAPESVSEQVVGKK